jgi:hypothetical protein
MVRIIRPNDRQTLSPRQLMGPSLNALFLSRGKHQVDERSLGMIEGLFSPVLVLRYSLPLPRLDSPPLVPYIRGGEPLLSRREIIQ